MNLLKKTTICTLLPCLLNVTLGYAQSGDNSLQQYGVYIDKKEYWTQKEAHDWLGLGCNSLFRHNARIDVAKGQNFKSDTLWYQINNQPGGYLSTGSSIPQKARVYIEVGEYLGDMSRKTSDSVEISSYPTMVEAYEYDWSGDCKRELRVRYAVTVDGPAELTRTSTATAYRVDGDMLRLRVGHFLNNKNRGATLEVATHPEDRHGWQTIAGPLGPNQELMLSYSDIAKGREAEWLGKPLQLRLKRKLYDDRNAYGSSVGPVRFYPTGMKFTVHQISTRSCDSSVSIKVSLAEPDKYSRYLTPDTTNLHWVIRRDGGAGNPAFSCRMEAVPGQSNTYKLIPADVGGNGEQSPFVPVDNNVVWLLQLVETKNTGTWAFSQPFTIPRKPRPITVEQMAPQHNINGVLYHVPSSNSHWAMLNITDPDYASHHRVPYTVWDNSGQRQLASIMEPGKNTYGELPPLEKARWDEEFNKAYSKDSANLTIARSKFMADNNPIQLLPHSVGHIAMPTNGSYLLFTKLENGVYNMYMAIMNGASIVSIRQVTQGDNVGNMEIVPNSNTCIYKKYGVDGLYKVSLAENHPVTGSLLSAKARSATYDYETYQSEKMEYPRCVYYHSARGRFEIISEYDNALYSIAVLNGEEKYIWQPARMPAFTSESAGLFRANIDAGTTHGYLITRLDLSSSKPSDNTFYSRCSCTEGSVNVFYPYTACTMPSSGNYDYYSCGEQVTCNTHGDKYSCYKVANYKRYICPDSENFLEALMLEMAPDESVAFVRLQHSSGQRIVRVYKNKETIIPNGDFFKIGQVVTLPGNAKNAGYCFSSGGKTYRASSYYSGSVLPEPINSYTSTNICFESSDSYFLFVDNTTKNVYKQYLSSSSQYYELEPLFKEHYKQQWLAQQIGTKVRHSAIQLNTLQIWTLKDADSCPSDTFHVFVKAPLSANFSVVKTKDPENSCAQNGEATITYGGGGVIPYTHGNGRLYDIGSSIVVEGLGYGKHEIVLRDANGNESEHLMVDMGSVGITSVTTTPQTCSTPNGKISVSTGGLNGLLTYTLKRLVNTSEQLVQTHSTSGTSYTFEGLSSGYYKVVVTAPGGCVFEDPTEYAVAAQEFSRSLTVKPSSTLSGEGSMAVKFANRNGSSISWSLDGVGSSSVTDDVLNRSGIAPGTHVFVAQNSSTGCTLRDTFTIDKPAYSGELRIAHSKDSCRISTGYLSGNALFDSYTFRLEKNGAVLAESRMIDTVIREKGEYSLYAYSSQSGDKSRQPYEFSFYGDTLSAGVTVTAPLCHGDSGSITFSNLHGIFGNPADSLDISFDWLSYSKGRAFRRSASAYTAYLRDGKMGTLDGLKIYHSMVQPLRFTLPDATEVNAQVRYQDPLCTGANNGQIWVQNATGGSGKFEYRVGEDGTWSDTTATTQGLQPGIYKLYLRDSRHGCANVYLHSVTLHNPEPLRVDSLLVRQPICEQANGRLSAKISGGSRWYALAWYKDGALYDSVDYRRDTALLPLDTLPHGYYRLQATDGNGCRTSASITLRQYHNPAVGSLVVTPALCHRSANGAVVALPAATTSAPDSLTLQHLQLPLRYSALAPDLRLAGLDTGRYALYLYDSLGCRSNQPYPVEIKEPEHFRIAVNSITPVVNKGAAEGQLAFTLQGGNDSVKNIVLQNSNYQDIASLSNRGGIPLFFTKLAAGSYRINATDRRGCTDSTALLSVVEPAHKLGFTVTEKRDALCKAQVGSITVEGFGGWGKYGYKRTANSAYSPHNTFEKLTAGRYLISVSDSLGASFTDTIAIYEPKDSLDARVVGITPPSCGSNGELLVGLSGGSAPYKLFENADTTHVALPQNTTLSNLPSGAHLLQVVDANGCRFALEAVLPDTGELKILSFNITHPGKGGAADGAVEVITSGGSAPYNYRWSHNGASLAAAAAKAENLTAGFYTVTVSENEGCSASQNVYLPNAGDAAFEVVKVSPETSYAAANGNAILRSPVRSLSSVKLFSPQGASMLYAATDLSDKFQLQNDTVFFGQLSGGTWYAEGKNAEGEKVSGEFSITPYLQFKITNVQITHAAKPGAASGSVSVEVAGGAGSNIFTWKSAGNNTLSTQLGGQSSTLKNLAAGSYTLTVEDSFGNSLQQIVEVLEPSQALTLTVVEQKNESCKTYRDAYLSMGAVGGWGSYQWRHDSEKYFSNSPRFDMLAVRSHHLYLTDAYGNLDSLLVSITEPDYLRSSVSLVDSVDCKNTYSGSIAFNLTGGTAPYRLREKDVAPAWTAGVLAQGLNEGFHSFVFTDSNGCACADTLRVYMPEPDSLLPANFAVRHTLCDMDNGAMHVTMQGGTRPYRYAWTDFYNQPLGTDSTVGNLQRNQLYKLRVSDLHGCTYDLEQRIQPSTKPRVNTVATKEVLCYGDSTGQAKASSITAAAPFAPYTLLWSNGDTGVVSHRFNHGTHHVVVTDTNGCTTTTYFEVAQPDSLRAMVLTLRQPHCFGYSDALLQVKGLGGAPKYSYLWSTGDTTPYLDSIAQGTYLLTLSDTNSCVFRRSYTMPQPELLHADLGPDITICPGNSYTLDGKNYVIHRWYNAGGDVGHERYFTARAEGSYLLQATDARGCSAYDTINVTIGESALKADFLLSSEAVVGDTLILFELSNLLLDSLRWQYSSDDFTNISSEAHKGMEYVLLLQPQAAGNHDIGLFAYAGGCLSYVSKQVAVLGSSLDEPRANTLGYHEPLITSMVAYPNPSTGEFYVDIELREQADIRMSLYSFHARLDEKRASGLSRYTLRYSLPGLPSGIYILVLQAGSEHRQMKIMKK